MLIKLLQVQEFILWTSVGALGFSAEAATKFVRWFATYSLLAVDMLLLFYLFKYALMIENNLYEHLERITHALEASLRKLFFFLLLFLFTFFKWFKYINQRVLLKFSHFWIFSCRLLRWTLKISKWFLLMSPLSVFWMLSKHQF